VGTNEVVAGEIDNGFTDWWLLYVNGGSSRATQNGATLVSETIGPVMAVNTWSHVCGTFGSNSNRISYTNGVASATDTTTVDAPATASFGIGGSPALPTLLPWQGSLSNVAIWNVALSADEVQTLAQGVSPLRLRRDSLVRYWPMNRLTGAERDIVGAFNMPEVNGPIAAADEPIPTAGVPFAFAGRVAAF
jgi:hypothetical protein